MKRLFALMLLLASPVMAETYTPPAGCTATITYHTKSCVVSHLMVCDFDPEGYHWRATFFDDGRMVLGQYDHEANWAFTDFTASGTTEVLDPTSPDLSSLTTLFRESYDDYDFTRYHSGGYSLHYKGWDKLTGETVIIDDVPLFRTQYDIYGRYADGTEFWHGYGFQYASPDFRRFFGGIDHSERDGQITTEDNSPVDFVRPGEDGFLTTKPLYGCETATS